MVRGMHRNNSLRRVVRKAPGGELHTHFKRRKPSKASCGMCGNLLQGVPRVLPYKMENMPKSQKRPERPFGGVLCTKCVRLVMKSQARALQ